MVMSALHPTSPTSMSEIFRKPLKRGFACPCTALFMTLCDRGVAYIHANHMRSSSVRHGMALPKALNANDCQSRSWYFSSRMKVIQR